MAREVAAGCGGGGRERTRSPAVVARRSVEEGGGARATAPPGCLGCALAASLGGLGELVDWRSLGWCWEWPRLRVVAAGLSSSKAVVACWVLKPLVSYLWRFSLIWGLFLSLSRNTTLKILLGAFLFDPLVPLVLFLIERGFVPISSFPFLSPFFFCTDSLGCCGAVCLLRPQYVSNSLADLGRSVALRGAPCFPYSHADFHFRFINNGTCQSASNTSVEAIEGRC